MSEAFRTRQNLLFIESFEDAIEATAAACGGKKAFAVLLRPDLADDPEKALRWFLDALNPDRRTEFHADHLRKACFVARAHDCHVLKHWFDDAAGYERTDPAPQKTELQKLAARRLELSRQLAEVEEQVAQQLRNVLPISGNAPR